MMKKAKITIVFLSIYSLCFFGLMPLARAVDGSDPTGINGHVMSFSGGAKAVCENCHIPHAAKGEKIWARAGYEDIKIENKQNVTVRDLCESCHHEGFADFANLSAMAGLHMIDGYSKHGNVCMKDEDDNLIAASHVMGSEYKGKRHSSKADVPDIFPMDTDEEGFYCGSCHNPHKQPLKCGPGDGLHGNGDYLRTANTEVNVGTEHNRQGFCRQCHPEDGPTAQIHKDTTSTADLRCDECHHVHDGKKYENPTPAQAKAQKSIFWMTSQPGWYEFPPRSGSQRYITASDEYFESSSCIGCHIYSVDTGYPKLSPDIGHHPMGKIWTETSCSIGGESCHKPTGNDLASANIEHKSFPLDGTSDETGNTPLDFSRQRFSCISCHANHTEVVQGNPAFLRFASFEGDNTAFCEYCHDSILATHRKRGNLLKDKGDDGNTGKHFKTQTEAKSLPLQRRVWNKDNDTYDYDIGCGGCMLCHFIHSNKDNDDRIIGSEADPLRADIDSLMRVPPLPLNWGQQEYGQNKAEYKRNSIAYNNARYEDLCYGCHGKTNIVGQIKTGSLLNTIKFSHRFACKPVSDNTKSNISVGAKIGIEKFPLADGKPGAAGGIMDDYGTIKDRIYCGTCHDVHMNVKPPYLYPFSIEPKDTGSPYLADDPETTGVIEGFCEQCHCTAENPDPMSKVSTHPVGTDKKPSSKTDSEWPEKFYGGKSGSDHGITLPNTKDGGVLCLSCHNVHAAATAWDGTVVGETSPTSSDDKGPHGQILVLDNYSEAPGSNMCVECHPQFE